jgi:pyruvate kinase
VQVGRKLLDGADAVMLSSETYPIETPAVMSHIAVKVGCFFTRNLAGKSESSGEHRNGEPVGEAGVVRRKDALEDGVAPYRKNAE